MNPTVAIWVETSCARPGYAASFVIFDIRALWRFTLSVRVPGCQKLAYKWRLDPVWHRMLYMQ